MVKQNQTLASISPAPLERFLMELANLKYDRESVIRFQKRFGEFIPPLDKSWFDPTKAQTGRLPTDYIPDAGWLTALRDVLRVLWLEPDARLREWKIFAARYQLYKAAESVNEEELLWESRFANPYMPISLPPPTPFERALVHLLRFAHRTRLCPNPECPAPYFFAKRKNQRYCSEICAAPAQREMKRQWWADYGDEWRAERQKRLTKRKPANHKAGGRLKQEVKARKKGK